MKKATFQTKNGQALFPIGNCSLFLPSTGVCWQVSNTEMARENIGKEKIGIEKILYLLILFSESWETACASVFVVD